MSTLREPAKWLIADDEIADHLRPALRIAQADGPSAAEHDRMWSSLAARLPGVVSVPEAVRPESAAFGGGAGSALLRSTHVGLWKIVGTGIVAAALGFGAAKLTARPSELERPAGVARPAGAQQPRAHELAHSAPAPVRAESLAAIDHPPVSAQPPRSAFPNSAAMDETSPSDASHSNANANARPTVAATLRAGRRVEAGSPVRSANTSRARSSNGSGAGLAGLASSGTPPRDPGPRSASTDLGSELDLLARARRVVAGSPARALQLTAEHAQRFPDGVLAQEREVLAIEALYRLGQRDLAAKRAKRFSERYPDSAHRVRLDAELREQ